MRINADHGKCEGLGMCEAMADQFFEVGDDGLVHVLNDEPAGEDEQLVEAAVRACPVAALALES